VVVVCVLCVCLRALTLRCCTQTLSRARAHATKVRATGHGQIVPGEGDGNGVRRDVPQRGVVQPGVQVAGREREAGQVDVPDGEGSECVAVVVVVSLVVVVVVVVCCSSCCCICLELLLPLVFVVIWLVPSSSSSSSSSRVFCPADCAGRCWLTHACQTRIRAGRTCKPNTNACFFFFRFFFLNEQKL
jgi:hypothetical protein